MRFRGVRQFVGNLIAGVAAVTLFVVLLISIAVTPPANGSGKSGAVLAAAAIVLFAGGLIRMRVAFTVTLEDEALVYRTLLTTRRFARSDIAGIDRQLRYRGLAKIMQPYLRMKDGGKVWLADMGMGQLIAPNSTMQERMITAVREWVEVNPPVTPPRSG